MQIVSETTSTQYKKQDESNAITRGKLTAEMDGEVVGVTDVDRVRVGVDEELRDGLCVTDTDGVVLGDAHGGK
jgi:hypothetical protein